MKEPLIAIVGRPNVGKSTLFNRLVGGRPALVHDTPGLTRDRRYGQFEYFGRRLAVVDTGGLDPAAEREVIGAGIHRQAQAALDECELILLVIDARAGITPLDKEVATSIRKLGKPVVVVANKVDGPKTDVFVHELHQLGLGEPFGVSAAHGRGVDDVLQHLVDVLQLDPSAGAWDDSESECEADEGREEAEPPLRIAFIGKPNAGKSSLINRLLGVERSLVHNQPGTTTDPVDTPFEFGGRRYVLVDTAGIRRKARVDEDTEKISVSLAISQLRRADVAVLVVDGAEEPSEQDARLAGMAIEAGRALVVALNKADLLEGAGAESALRQKTSDEFHFLRFVAVHLISALRGDGVGELMALVDAAAIEHRRRIPTPELNRFFSEVCQVRPPPPRDLARLPFTTSRRAPCSPRPSSCSPTTRTPWMPRTTASSPISCGCVMAFRAPRSACL